MRCRLYINHPQASVLSRKFAEHRERRRGQPARRADREYRVVFKGGATPRAGLCGGRMPANLRDRTLVFGPPIADLKMVKPVPRNAALVL